MADAVFSWQYRDSTSPHYSRHHTCTSSSHHMTSQPTMSHNHIALQPHPITFHSFPSHRIKSHHITWNIITSHHIISSHLTSTQPHDIIPHHHSTSPPPTHKGNTTNQPLKQLRQTEWLIANPYKKFVLGRALVGGAAQFYQSLSLAETSAPSWLG